jgi:tetratricopeptide (TPR) repeat protein
VVEDVRALGAEDGEVLLFAAGPAYARRLECVCGENGVSKMRRHSLRTYHLRTGEERTAEPSVYRKWHNRYTGCAKEMVMQYRTTAIRLSRLVAVAAVLLVGVTATSVAQSFQDLIEEGNNLADEGLYEEALRAYDRAIEMDDSVADAYYNRGTIQLELGRVEAAVEDFTRAIDIRGEFGQAYFNRGNARYRLGEYASAVEDFSNALGAVENEAEVLHNRGLAEYARGNVEAAIVDFTEAIAGREGYMRAYFNRGVANYDMGNYREAAEDFRRVVDQEPENAQALYNLGASYIRLSQELGSPEDEPAPSSESS